MVAEEEIEGGAEVEGGVHREAEEVLAIGVVGEVVEEQ